MKYIFVLLFLLSMQVNSSEGILVLAHGTQMHADHKMGCEPHQIPQWERYVLSTIEEVKRNTDVPIEVVFGMWNSKCIDKGIERLGHSLALQGTQLTHLKVFPLFISSHSLVIEMQKFIFKKRSDRVIPIPSVTQTKFNGKITYLNALDYDPRLSLVLSDRFHRLIHIAKERGYEKSQMELVFVMHGPVEDHDNIQWEKMGRQYLSDLTYLFPVATSHVLSLRDDAPEDVRQAATQKLREIVSGSVQKGRIALILPLLVAKGGIESGIIKRLEGLDYIWEGKMLFPDPQLPSIIINRL